MRSIGHLFAESRRGEKSLVPHLASGGSLSFCGERKGGKNAAKTNGFGILARAWRGMCRDLSAPRIKWYKPAPCFRTVSASIHRDALRACAARPDRGNSCVLGIAPYEICR